MSMYPAICDLGSWKPLEGSLNPVNAGPLPASLVQQHFVGDRDKVVPLEIVAAAARRLGAQGVIVLQGVSHARGWDRAWPSILVGEEGVSTAGAGSAELVTQPEGELAVAHGVEARD